MHAYKHIYIHTHTYTTHLHPTLEHIKNNTNEVWFSNGSHM